MKLIAQYFFMTLIIIQGLFLAFWYFNINFLGVLSWIGKGDSYDSFKLFSPLLAFGAIKILYWFADPLSKLFTLILNWAVICGIFYGLFWLFFL
jgi:hypothetical protein